MQKNPTIQNHRWAGSFDWSKLPDKMPEYPKNQEIRNKIAKNAISWKKNWLKELKQNQYSPKYSYCLIEKRVDWLKQSEEV